MDTPHVVERTNSGGFQSADGTFYVSKPYRSRSTKKLRATITFTSRASHFDTNNVSSGTNEFRGFFTLFWIAIFLFMTRTYIEGIEANGTPLNLQFATLFSRHALPLALSDATLVLSTGVCVPFAKLLAKDYIKYHWTGVIIQHSWQTLVLAITVKWTFDQQWPWVQSGFLTLHCLVMLMKMHSYIYVNGYLQWVDREAKKALAILHKETERVGGYETAVAVAKIYRKEADSISVRSDSGSSTPDGSNGHAGGEKSFLEVEVSAAAVLRQRLAVAAAAARNETVMAEHIAEITEEVGPHPLVGHPDEKISELAQEFSGLDAELVSTGPAKVRWPNNISWSNFVDYQVIPTLVYDLEYPRTERIRPFYVFEKTVATFGTFTLLYSVTEVFILPKIHQASFFRALLDLTLPFMVAYLLLFYIVFECICNGFAELSRFADRQFYEDWEWWNSTSWDEFSRKWNRPVHQFLLRHVYASTMRSYKLSKTSAMFITFLLSAAVHELVMVVVTQKIRMYLFMAQIVQIPLIAVGRIPAIRRNKILGNVFFWLSLFSGFPLLCVLYVVH
ncbi:MBOAT-domain-containing protein [Thelephora ganbajun]|uniref:MBOAT-domain-containing protein n=1 Tax=Thelephora ganbajun TaxID=370292 RepID=A0ACB6ZD29_THEGA|nr:MBOAT-domain-containing protein [Thelephora ganbajun]